MASSRTLPCLAAPKWCCRAAVAVAFVALVASSPAAAEICKYVDADGNIHYSNVPPDKGFRKLSCTLGDDAPPPRRSPPAAPNVNGGAVAPTRATPAPPASAPAGFPRVDAETQKGRDDIRRKVLGDELAAEEKLLVEARSAFADGAPPPLPDERGDAEKYRQRIAKLRQSVVLHEKNIEAIRKELGAIR
jgi:hypothetical protein